MIIFKSQPSFTLERTIAITVCLTCWGLNQTNIWRTRLTVSASKSLQRFIKMCFKTFELYEKIITLPGHIWDFDTVTIDCEAKLQSGGQITNTEHGGYDSSEHVGSSAEKDPLCRPLPSVRRLLCARSIVPTSIGGLCLRRALCVPLHGPTQRAAHLTQMYNSSWRIVHNGLTWREGRVWSPSWVEGDEVWCT